MSVMIILQTQNNLLSQIPFSSNIYSSMSAQCSYNNILLLHFKRCSDISCRKYVNKCYRVVWYEDWESHLFKTARNIWSFLSHLKHTCLHSKTATPSFVKQQICAFQVNGHLDYMRQMDTILVAVGVPTKEVPETSFALHRTVTVSKATKEILDQVPSEQQMTHKQSQTEDGVNCSEETDEATDVTGDGWDIPDISDLLDSLSDAECVSHTKVGNSLPVTPEDEAAPEEMSACDGCVRDSPVDDNKHIRVLGWHPQTKTGSLTKSITLDHLLSVGKKNPLN